MQLHKESIYVYRHEKKYSVHIYYDDGKTGNTRGYYILIGKTFSSRKTLLVKEVTRQSSKALAEVVNSLAPEQALVLIDKINEDKINTSKDVELEQCLESKKRFSNIAGLSEVKEELLQLLEYLKNPSIFKEMDAHIPRGYLLYGPPGTGKTYLAKSLAKEADINFFYASASSFNEKYIGVGAKRVRDLFNKAKENTPCIIFIDELDSIGAKRDIYSNLAEKNDTLNQLLTEIDGFENQEDIFILGATNKIEMLDDALTRPGRLTTHVYVGNPDFDSRMELFTLYTKKKPLADDVDLKLLASQSHGFSCAGIKSMCNKASLIAISNNKTVISMSDFEEAFENAIDGLGSISKNLIEEERIRVAFHESGHAILSYLLGNNKLKKVRIIPKGSSLGSVIRIPEEDRYIKTKDDLLNEIKILLAGRISEELVLSSCSTGSSDDFQKASSIALKMVCEYAMDGSDVFFSQPIGYFENTTQSMYIEKANKILQKEFIEAKKLLKKNFDKLNKIANALLESEELDYLEIKAIMDMDISTDKIS